MTYSTPIIVTRPEPDASAFAAKAVASGYDPIVSPALAITFKSQLPDMENVAALAFTSANGVRALEAAGPPLGLPVFAVGPATAEAALAAGHTNIKTAGGDAASLAHLIIRDGVGAGNSTGGGEVLHIAGRHRAGDLVAALRASSVGARRVVLYEARPAPGLSSAALKFFKTAPREGWVALFSPRTARLFLDQCRKAGAFDALGNMRAACLSAAVAEAASAALWKSINVADIPTGEALLTMIKAQDGDNGA